jgi:DNA-directed RNA polymerase subunit M/transcription elongation factor TFIIS
MLTPEIQINEKHEFPSLNTETTDANLGIKLSYGLGWGLYFTPHDRAFFKEGHDDGWRHYAVCFEKSGTGILIMTNSSNGEGIYKPLLETLLRDTWTPIEWEGFTPYDQLPPRPSASISRHTPAQVDTRPQLSAGEICQEKRMKIAKTADRKKQIDTTKSTDCPKCGKPTRVAKRIKDRERDIPGGMYISCSACEFYEKL